MLTNKYGILLAVSSLPSNYGIGDFGVNAYEFIRFLSKKGYRYWQILPLNPIGPGNSPYISTCSEAIDFRYIDLEDLISRGYIKSIRSFPKLSNRVDYDRAYKFKLRYLKEAYKNFLKNPMKGFSSFKKNNSWVFPYALFTVLRESHGFESWNKWPLDEINYYRNHRVEEFPKKLKNSCNFHVFLQFIAFTQWNKLRKFANKKGIQIIADCPFYVGFDSVDCWLHKDEFLMDEKYNPTKVSGCPPDAFSDDGQLWGTPIYDFNKMKETNFSFLIGRIGYLASSCDYLRLDHFRAWDTYCVIPSEDTNAKRGEWWEGPRKEFFDILLNKYKGINLIAEDLGELFPSVHELRNYYNFPGMFVVEFTLFDQNAKSNDNMIVYPGTHDNQTVKGWIKTLSKDAVIYLQNKFNKKSDLYRSIMQYTWDLPSKMTIISMQDILGLDDKSRMNFPGTVGSPNWEWKLKDNSYQNKIKFGF